MRFGDLKIGDIFRYNNTYYIKTSYDEPKYLFEYNATNIEYNVGESIKLNTPVRIVLPKCAIDYINKEVDNND